MILLGGGTKKRQQKDIDKAKELWKDYKNRKKKRLKWYWQEITKKQYVQECSATLHLGEHF